jgi:DHA2 family multidrug resistance protein
VAFELAESGSGFLQSGNGADVSKFQRRFSGGFDQYSRLLRYSEGKNNSASALLNLSRNVGASLGIALTTTLVTQRTEVHANNLSYHASEYNPNFLESIDKIILELKQQGLTALQAKDLSFQMMWDSLVKQASMLAILETYQTFS